MTQPTLPQYAELTPAYGRDYKNAAAVKLDFAQGKDFVLNTWQGTTLCSIWDAAVGTSVQLRYNNSTRVIVFRVERKHLDALKVEVSA